MFTSDCEHADSSMPFRSHSQTGFALLASGRLSFGSCLSVLDMATPGSSPPLQSLACLEPALLIMDPVAPGPLPSLRNLARLGSAMSVVSVVRFGPPTFVPDYVLIGLSVSCATSPA